MSRAIERNDVLQMYLRQVRRFPLLSPEEEHDLAVKLRDTGDEEAARRLVAHNLRFVVRIAYQYRGYRIRMIDLVQEGNLGLIKAVERFDPDRGVRLVTYAVWWIRAYIQSFILQAWSLVRFGTTRAQRRLMFGLSRARQAIHRLSDGETTPESENAQLAERLGTTPEEIADTLRRIGQRDMSLDVPAGGDEESSPMVMRLASPDPSPESETLQGEVRARVAARLEAVMPTLDERERYILTHRLMADEPMLLREIAKVFGVSRERIRQVESALKKKLETRLSDLAEGPEAQDAQTVAMVA